MQWCNSVVGFNPPMVLGDNHTPNGGACNPGPSDPKNIGIVSNIATPHSQVLMA